MGHDDNAPWRFELRPAEFLVEGSLRVVAGEAVEVGASSITFRLSGRPSERVVLSFFRK